MAINKSYNESQVIAAIATALNNFYDSLNRKLDSLHIKEIMKRKNPYLYKAKGIRSVEDIVESVLNAHVSSSEETIFGNTFFEPLAIAASNGEKALAEGLDIIKYDKDENTFYAIAVKSGTSVFNADSKKKQELNFKAAKKRADQSKSRYVPIIGYSYGKKKKPKKDAEPQIYQELAGKQFWQKLTGDETFYQKIILYMSSMPEQFAKEYETSYAKAKARLVQEFTELFCNEDGSINWERLVEFNSGD